MKLPRLLPCPFCGRKVKAKKTRRPRGVFDTWDIWCECGIPCVIAYSREEAVRQWNERKL